MNYFPLYVGYNGFEPMYEMPYYAYDMNRGVPVCSPADDPMNAPITPPEPQRHILLKKTEEQDTCPITCKTYLELAKDHELTETPCGHKFSLPDLTAWLEQNSEHTCPTCRATVDIKKCVLVDVDTTSEVKEEKPVPPPAAEKNKQEAERVQKSVHEAFQAIPQKPEKVPEPKVEKAKEHKHKKHHEKKPHKQHKAHDVKKPRHNKEHKKHVHHKHKVS